jgi:hypothetical protein
MLKTKINLTFLLIIFFYCLYIFRQTKLTNGYERSVELIIAIALISIIFLYFYHLKRSVFGFIKTNFQWFISIIIAGILFWDFKETSIVLVKILLIMIFIDVLQKKDNIKIKLADAGILCIVIFGMANILTGIDNNIFINENWKKNSYGFFNPNIGPYFAFASLYVYFILKSEIRFWLLSMLIIIAWAVLDFFSRAFLIGSALLILYKVISLFSVDLKKLIFINFGIVILSLIISIVVACLLFLELIQINGIFQKIDHLSSARLYFFSKNPFVATSSGPIFKIDTFDSIYYEIIFVLGPYAVYSLCLWLKIALTNDKIIDLYGPEIIAISIFLFIGLFEGMIFKFSPMIILVWEALFFKKTMIWRKKNNKICGLVCQRIL